MGPGGPEKNAYDAGAALEAKVSRVQHDIAPCAQAQEQAWPSAMNGRAMVEFGGVLYERRRDRPDAPRAGAA